MPRQHGAEMPNDCQRSVVIDVVKSSAKKEARIGPYKKLLSFSGCADTQDIFEQQVLLKKLRMLQILNSGPRTFEKILPTTKLPPWPTPVDATSSATQAHFLRSILLKVVSSH